MLISHKDAHQIDGLSRSTRERLVKAEDYPEPVQITAGRLGFVRTEVEDWARARIAKRDAGRGRRPPERWPSDEAALSVTSSLEPLIGGMKPTCPETRSAAPAESGAGRRVQRNARHR